MQTRTQHHSRNKITTGTHTHTKNIYMRVSTSAIWCCYSCIGLFKIGVDMVTVFSFICGMQISQIVSGYHIKAERRLYDKGFFLINNNSSSAKKTKSANNVPFSLHSSTQSRTTESSLTYFCEIRQSQKLNARSICYVMK